jgi:hypothetical protein
VKVFGFYSECGRKASEGFESDVIWCNLYFKIISFLAAKWRLMVNCISEQRPDFKLHYSAKAIIIIIKKHGTVTKRDMKTSGTVYKRQIWIHTEAHLIFYKRPKHMMEKR